MVQLSHPTSNNAHEVLYFHFALGFDTQILAYTLDSLVRVSRRVITNHHLNIANTRVPPRPEVVQPPNDYIVLVRRSISWATLTEACYQVSSVPAIVQPAGVSPLRLPPRLPSPTAETDVEHCPSNHLSEDWLNLRQKEWAIILPY